MFGYGVRLPSGLYLTKKGKASKKPVFPFSEDQAKERRRFKEKVVYEGDYALRKMLKTETTWQIMN